MGPDGPRWAARIIRLCYEVKTAVDLTEQLALGPAMRSLQPGEILEAQDIVVSCRDVSGSGQGDGNWLMYAMYAEIC
jgi:hypothetical protein